MSIEAMKAALERLTIWLEDFPDTAVIEDHWAVDALRQAIAEAEKESTLQEISDIGQWDTSDMAHRPGGLSVEQEPVAWVRDLTSPQPHCVTSMKYLSIADTDAGVKYIPVYAAPPKREQEPIDRKTLIECIAGSISKHMTIGLYPKELLSAAEYIVDNYAAPPNRPVKSYTGGEPQYATDAPQAEGEPWLGSPDHCSLHPDAPHGYNRKQSLKEHRYVCRCEGWRPDMSTKPENIDTKTGCVDRVNIEPVAYKYTDKTNHLVFYFTDRKDVTPNPDVIETALYTAPPDVKHWKDLAEYRLQLLMKMPENKPVMRMLSKGEEPPKRKWVGLTDVEVGKYSDRLNGGDIAREVEAKLKEKNT
jgi:hypothetical protein